ncbi:helicase RepA family protein [Thioalkalivibrio sp. ALM2T]|uniref:AAA family ATPase n=1 Tax=Thioalkalivibrio sp. ALM2T TaxID=1158184 RepID=UPI00037E4C0C|nr:helicase RepA family protein [Thioalkalivibrio sp. ALM2T]
MSETIAIPVQKPAPGFRLVHIGDLEFRAPRFLIRDYLEAESLASLFGDPGCGKSFLAVDVACCVAAGVEFHGNPTSQGSVIYIAGEGFNGLKRRFVAWEKQHGHSLQEAPLYISSAPAALSEPKSALAVCEAVDAVPAPAPSLVVIDTVARNFGPGDENSTQDMGRFIQAADMIRTRYHCTVLLVHHTGHADKTRARGAMALKGALDAEYRMEQDETGRARVEPSKMKDADFPLPLAFELKCVPLGVYDNDGREVTSAALVSTHYEPSPLSPRPPRGRWQRTALSELERLYRERRDTLEAGGFDTGTARVSVDEWRDACIATGMARNRWHDAQRTLIENRFVTSKNRFVSPASDPSGFLGKPDRTDGTNRTNRTETGYESGHKPDGANP